MIRLIISYLKSLIQICKQTIKTSSRSGEKTGKEHEQTAHRKANTDGVYELLNCVVMLVNRQKLRQQLDSISHLSDFQRGEQMMGRQIPQVGCQWREYTERQFGSMYHQKQCGIIPEHELSSQITLYGSQLYCILAE